MQTFFQAPSDEQKIISLMLYIEFLQQFILYEYNYLPEKLGNKQQLEIMNPYQRIRVWLFSNLYHIFCKRSIHILVCLDKPIWFPITKLHKRLNDHQQVQ